MWCWDGIRWKSFLEKRKSRNFVIEAKEKENHFETEVRPGVYDIHSPRVPSVEEIVKALEIMLTKVDRDKLWGNPDCGLKHEALQRQMRVFEIWWKQQNRSEVEIPDVFQSSVSIENNILVIYQIWLSGSRFMAGKSASFFI